MTAKYIRVENKIQEVLKELRESTKPNVAEAARWHASALGGKGVSCVTRGPQQVEGLLTIKILLFVAILIAWIPYIPPLDY